MHPIWLPETQQPYALRRVPKGRVHVCWRCGIASSLPAQPSPRKIQGRPPMLCADGLPMGLPGACRRGSDAGSPPAEGSEKRLRQLLHRSGLESDGEAGGGSESEDDADEDLDAMASGLQTKVCTSRCWCSSLCSFCSCKV